MNLNLNVSLAELYTSNSQKARVMTEDWASRYAICPNCPSTLVLEKLPNNAPVADLQCSVCLAQYELKAKAGKIGQSISDGAYHTMLERLTASTNPHLIMMRYKSSPEWQVQDLFVVPNFLFVPKIIQPRKPLSLSAKRAGWQGCNILLGAVPDVGRVSLLIDKQPVAVDRVRNQWQKARELFAHADQIDSKTWLLAILRCLDCLKYNFSLANVYAFENKLQIDFPKNKHIRAKIRQQLQILRDLGYIRFLGNGKYERLTLIN